MVANEVARGGDGADNLRALANESADEEEGGADVVLRQDVKQTLGDDVVGSVVVGEGDFVGVAGGDEDLAEDLGLR